MILILPVYSQKSLFIKFASIPFFMLLLSLKLLSFFLCGSSTTIIINNSTYVMLQKGFSVKMNVLNFSHRTDRYQRNSQVYQPDREHSERKKQETGKNSEHLNMLQCNHHRFRQVVNALQSPYSIDVSILTAMLHHLAEIVLHENEQKQIMLNKMHCTKIKISKTAIFPNTFCTRKHNSI